VVLWWLAHDPTLERAARDAITDGANWAGVSAATVWEIGIKRAAGKLDAPDNLLSVLETSNVDPLSITVEHADAAAALPRHHDNPFERMLVAQATIEGLTIVTRDKAFARYGVPVLPG
jgi:PIN domain nuclease of toxin-antitoxin system